MTLCHCFPLSVFPICENICDTRQESWSRPVITGIPVSPKSLHGCFKVKSYVDVLCSSCNYRWKTNITMCSECQVLCTLCTCSLVCELKFVLLCLFCLSPNSNVWVLMRCIIPMLLYLDEFLQWCQLFWLTLFESSNYS